MWGLFVSWLSGITRLPLVTHKCSVWEFGVRTRPRAGTNSPRSCDIRPLREAQAFGLVDTIIECKLGSLSARLAACCASFHAEMCSFLFVTFVGIRRKQVRALL